LFLERGCDYEGILHKEGEQWHDGCKYNCTCVDGDTGAYRCVAR